MSYSRATARPLGQAPPRIAGYCRISVDLEQDRDNTSIEHQKDIIEEYRSRCFPDSSLEIFVDRDRSGYTFEQREGYQELRRRLYGGEFDILMVKDFSRFSRRNSLGLYELENLRDEGLRLISIGDNVDFPANDDWLSIQFRFLMNELPVTDTSKKVRNVVRMRQEKGEWLVNAPYGYYISPFQKNKVFIDEEGKEAVLLIFDLYIKGWGYKKIAEHLTKEGYPTATALQIKHLAARGGDTSKVEARLGNHWSHVSVSKILANDFYIGTLRSGVWRREGINKKDKRTDESKHIVFPDHHEAIITPEVFALAQRAREMRGVNHYKGMRKYENPYSGRLLCADCGAPLFSLSNPKRPPGYICGNYHRFGRSACTSHHIREAVLDEHLQAYLQKVRDNLLSLLTQLNAKPRVHQLSLANDFEREMAQKIDGLKAELRELGRQRLRKLVSGDSDEELINETFDLMERDITGEIRKLTEERILLGDKKRRRKNLRRDINSQVAVFDELLEKQSFSREEVGKIVEKIVVGEDGKIVIMNLHADITALLENE